MSEQAYSSSLITLWFTGWFWCAQAGFLLQVTKSMFLNQWITRADRFRLCAVWECLVQGITLSSLKQSRRTTCCGDVGLQHCLVQATDLLLVQADLTNSDIARGAAPSTGTKFGVWLCHKPPQGRCLPSAAFEESKCSRERREASNIWMVLSTEELNNSIWNSFITKKSEQNYIFKIENTLF